MTPGQADARCRASRISSFGSSVSVPLCRAAATDWNMFATP